MGTVMAKRQFDQEADLRVVTHREGQYQLLFFARMHDFDLYAGPARMKKLLRSSYHASGAVHTHTPEGRLDGEPRMMPKDFRGRENLYSGWSSGTDWSYRLKPNSSTRLTLIIESMAMERGLMLDLWAVEPQRDDLVTEILEEYGNKKGVELISSARVDWTRPQLMVVASTLTVASYEAFKTA